VEYTFAGVMQKTPICAPNRLFTADSRIVTRSAGNLTDDKLQEVVDAIVEIIKS
jgi:hypothetical protein